MFLGIPEKEMGPQRWRSGWKDPLGWKDPWVGRIPWRRKWQPTPVFLPGQSRGQRSLVSYRPGVTQARPQLSDWAKRTPRRRGPYHWEQLKAHFNRLKQKFFTRDVNSGKKIKLRLVHYSQSPAWHGQRDRTQLSSMGSSHAHLSIVQQVSLEPKEMDDIIRVLYIVCWRRKWQATPVFLLGESQRQRSLVGCCPWNPTESDTTEATACIHALEKEMATHSSVLAWRIPGTEEPGGLLSVGSQSRTRLKWLSSSSSIYCAVSGGISSGISL